MSPWSMDLTLAYPSRTFILSFEAYTITSIIERMTLDIKKESYFPTTMESCIYLVYTNLIKNLWGSSAKHTNRPYNSSLFYPLGEFFIMENQPATIAYYTRGSKKSLLHH